MRTPKAGQVQEMGQKVHVRAQGQERRGRGMESGGGAPHTAWKIPQGGAAGNRASWVCGPALPFPHWKILFLNLLECRLEISQTQNIHANGFESES